MLGVAAALTRIRTGPTRSASATTEASSPTSAVANRGVRQVRFPIEAAAAARSSSVRATSTTSAPSSDS